MHTSNMLLRSNGLHEMDAWGGRQMHRTWPESASCSLATVYRGMVRLGVSGGRVCANSTYDDEGLPRQVRRHGSPHVPMIRAPAPSKSHFRRHPTAENNAQVQSTHDGRELSCGKGICALNSNLPDPCRCSSLCIFRVGRFQRSVIQHCANRGASTAALVGQAAPRRRGLGSTAPTSRGLPVGAVLRRRCCRRSGFWCRPLELRCAERPHKRAYILSRSAAGILIQLNPRNRIRVHH